MDMTPGLIALIGSGETSPTGGLVFETLARSLPPKPNICILETPAGFELNSPLVAGRVADFLKIRLQNYQPAVQCVAARKKGTPYSPDEPEIVAPLLKADLIYCGAGSPSYAVRQLSQSLAWELTRARHLQGSALAFASAAAIAIGRLALPVYEIFKVGEDIHWKPGLNLLAPFGLSLMIVPHWNNAEGCKNLDTSRCFMGESRFEQMQKMLSAQDTVLGLDEHTSVILDLNLGNARVYGSGAVHVLRDVSEKTFQQGDSLPLNDLGEFHPLPDGEQDISPDIWRMIQQAQENLCDDTAPPEVLRLAEQRQAARNAGNWEEADRLRAAIQALGWQVKDTPQKTILEKK